MVRPWGTELPWHLRAIRHLFKNRYRGSYRLLKLALRWGWFNRIVEYDAGNNVKVKIPLCRASNLSDYLRDDYYERPLLERMVEEVRPRPRPVTLMDVGDDIGLFSTLLAALGLIPECIFAFEPNSAAVPFLKENLGRLICRTNVLPQAVSDFAGHGELCVPDYETLDHSLFLKPSPDGRIPVTRIDDLHEGGRGTLVLKVDVEGGELSVLRGARETLGRAEAWVAVLEAHRDVVSRTRIDPTQCLRFLKEVGPCKAYIGEQPAVLVRDDTPFFDQVPGVTVCNIICASQSGHILGGRTTV
jgi:FkbM family methyltransferase